MTESTELMTVDNICNRVYIIRGQQVMLDYDLAEIYGYEVKRLNEQVKRNIVRFPEDFLKSQIATLNENGNKRGLHIKKIAVCIHGARYLYGLPTEQAYHCGASSKDAGKKL